MPIVNTVKGDLLKATEPFIAHGCNCRGVMGAGVAIAIAKRWPEVFKLYQDIHIERGLQLGSIHYIPTNDTNQVVINCMTQETFGTGRQVSYDAVDACFQKINSTFPRRRIAIPMIGAGLAGGNWEVIRRIIDDATPDVSISVYVL